MTAVDAACEHNWGAAEGIEMTACHTYTGLNCRQMYMFCCSWGQRKEAKVVLTNQGYLCNMGQAGGPSNLAVDQG